MEGIGGMGRNQGKKSSQSENSSQKRETERMMGRGLTSITFPYSAKAFLRPSSVVFQLKLPVHARTTTTPSIYRESKREISWVSHEGDGGNGDDRQHPQRRRSERIPFSCEWGYNNDARLTNKKLRAHRHYKLDTTKKN